MSYLADPYDDGPTFIGALVFAALLVVACALPVVVALMIWRAGI